MNFVGIDNGVTGSIGVVNPSGFAEQWSTPIVKELSYQKAKKYVSRIDHVKLRNLLKGLHPIQHVALERPMVNPTRWTASLSAMRSLESTLIVLEELMLPFSYIDSKEWQRVLLPKGCEGPELKRASLDIGRRLFPNVKFSGDADGILIAEYTRRRYASKVND